MKNVIFIFILCLSFGTLMAQDAATFKNAGNAAIKAKDYAKAVANYEKAIAVWGTAAPDYPMIYNTAVCAIQIKDYEKAVKYFDMAIAGNYNPEDSFFNKAMVLKLQKKNEEYVKVMNEGITKFPENTKFKSDLAKYYLRAGSVQYNNGAKLLKSAIDKLKSKKYKDTNDPAYLADIENAKKEFSDAIPSLDKAIELNPADATAKTIKSNCEKQLNTL
ncbi:MAG TPA: tetratricopeptide repeat protein [Prolixibacteraceae bacterium]|nr:tetratricopeptide repeat protein [Prolixibacteraceae bacterium]